MARSRQQAAARGDSHDDTCRHTGRRLISSSRRATARLSHLEAQPMKDASDWLARYRRFWEERYEQLDELLETLRRSAPTDGASDPDIASRKDGCHDHPNRQRAHRDR